jgi:hypothetical protein
VVHDRSQLASSTQVSGVHRRPGQALCEPPDAVRADSSDRHQVVAQRVRDRAGSGSGLSGEDVDQVTNMPEVRDELQGARDSTQVPSSGRALGKTLSHPGFR